MLEAEGGEDGPVVGFRLSDGRSGRPLGAFPLPSPATAPAGPSDAAAVLAAILREHGVDHVYASSLAGADPGRGVPTTFVHHAWPSACAPAAARPGARPRQPRPPAAARARHVATSVPVATALHAAHPQLAPAVIEVADGTAEAAFGDAEDSRRLRVAVFAGGAADEAALLATCFEHLRLFADLHLFAAPEVERLLAARWRVTIQSGARQDALRAAAPDLAIVLAGVPSAYLLADLRAAGVPALLRAPANGLSAPGQGFGYDSAAALVTAVAALEGRRGDLRAASRELRRRAPRSARDVVLDFYASRGDLASGLGRAIADSSSARARD